MSSHEPDLDHARERILKPSVTLDGWPEVKGYDFNDEWDFSTFVDSFATTGFQAHALHRSIAIAREMQDADAKIFLGYTSNMVSSGVRESIRWLVEHDKVALLVTTAGGIEEDVIKCLKPFVLGSYDARGSILRDEGVNRTGNIFIPNDRYLLLERFLKPFFEKMLERQKTTGEVLSESEFIYYLGLELNDDRSIITWAARNNIPYFCPGIYDGSLGDMLYFFKKKHPDFMIDAIKDTVRAYDFANNCETVGIMALGGSVPKHFVANLNILRDGANYAIYITTATEHEGSNAGANTEEAISWGKIAQDAKHQKVVAEATLIFPLFVKAAFVDHRIAKD
jgi:deoxyhypusine synthase